MGKTLDRLPESPYDRTPTRPTVGWMRQLPPHVVPHELARQYARIANRLARLWDTPTPCREYLDSLLLDRRGGRRGFAPEVLKEIRTLSDHYCRQHPLPKSGNDIWEEVRERVRSRPIRHGRD
jgi:hypothetical protein